MSDNDTTVEMDRRPACDICAEEGRRRKSSYDAKMVGGLGWAYLCETHFRSHTNGKLGLGEGQRIIGKW